MFRGLHRKPHGKWVQSKKPARECLKSHKEIKVELIGRSQINDYNGFKNVNIMIDNIELSLAEPKVKALF